MSEEQDQLSPAETVRDSAPAVMYFPVSPLKLLVMSVCTFGVYDLFWHFNNWLIIKERDELKISPILRAIFAFIFGFPLFRRIQATAEAQKIRKSFPAAPLAIGWVVFRFFGALPAPFWLVFFLAVLFLLPVQIKVNEINRSAAPGHDPNSKFTVWNKVAFAIGGLVWVLAVIGTFIPTK